MENKLVAPLEWSNERRQVKQLVPYDFNPRKLTEERKQLLINSIEKFNLAEVPAINTDNVIIAGHQRIKVLMELGRGDEYIDVRVPNRMLTEVEFKEYNITSNVPVGFWDVDILEEHFKDIDLEGLGLILADIEIPGEGVQNGFSPEVETNFDPAPPKVAISQLGDVYEFKSSQKGIRHILICGDSTNELIYSKLCDHGINLIVTDPPYNVNVQGGTKDHLTIKNDNMKSEDFYTFLYQFYKNSYSVSVPGAPIYVFHADIEGVNFRKALTDAGFKHSQCLIWVKNSIVMCRQDYHWKHEPCLYSEHPVMDVEKEVTEHEPCLYGWKEGAAHPWHSDRKQSTILEFNRPYKSAEHPTMKPIEMIIYLIKNSSKQNDYVLDPFGGSGTTMISCEQSWRNSRIIELDERYVDVHVKRYVKYMRENGLSFEITRNGNVLSNEDFEQYLE